MTLAPVVSVCGVRGDLNRHDHPDQHLQERRPHHRQDLQHPAQADFLHSKLEVRILCQAYICLTIVSPGPRLTVSSISLASQDLSRATTLPGASFSSLRSTTTASGQRRATAPSSGRSPPPPPRTPSVSGPHPQLRLSPMDVTPLPTRASSSFLT